MYAEIILPQVWGRASSVLTYAVPLELEAILKRGQLVSVPIQNRKSLGIVWNIHNTKPDYNNIKEIFRILNQQSVLSEWQLDVSKWISDYYYANLAKVIKLWTPKEVWQGDFGASQREIVYLKERNPSIVETEVRLIESVKQVDIAERYVKQRQVVEYLRVSGAKSLEDIKDACGVNKAVLDGLAKKGVVEMIEKQVSMWEFTNSSQLLLAKQAAILTDLHESPQSLVLLKRKYDLHGQKFFQELFERGWIEKKVEDIRPIKTDYNVTRQHLKELSVEQQAIVDEIAECVPSGTRSETCSRGAVGVPVKPEPEPETETETETPSDTDTIQKPFLIHGITGSGKTEVYLHLALQCIQKGQQVILLVPEIALTPQLLAYFSRVFGDELALIHSRLSDREKMNEWHAIWMGYKKVIIGSRSALFAPVQNLGAIIVDEEHEWTYKQDQEPRYHVREVAQKIQKLTGCMLVFGSATPDTEAYYHAKQGDWKLLSMPNRVQNASLPEVQIVDLREELHKKNYSIFSYALKNKIAEKLAKKQQVMLFLNKRGAHSAVLCRDCGYVCKCPLCDTTMAHHLDKRTHAGKLLCHYCGSLQLPPTLCPHCKSVNIRYIGTGTQKVEEEIKKLFPEARVFRADRDTTSKKASFQDLYDDLSAGKIDILVGTQMIAKGYDIPNVTLVGIILADTSLHIPDFRNSERLFQLITQVAGRAGRGLEAGEVLIQTYSPEHPSLLAAKEHNFNKFYEKEIVDREELQFPPFHKIIKLTYTHPSKVTCLDTIHKMRDECVHRRNEIQKTQPEFKCEIYTAPALIPRLHNKYHFHIILKGPSPDELLRSLTVPVGFRIDVDPVRVC